jgi:hypothetical protein
MVFGSEDFFRRALVAVGLAITALIWALLQGGLTGNPMRWNRGAR